MPADSALSPFPRLQDLAPRQAQLVLHVIKDMQALGVRQGDSLLLALSGGADSTALACLLALAAPILHLRLHALTCNHGLRPEAAEETRDVEALCRRLALPCRTVTLDVRAFSADSHTGLEDAGRSLRYQALEEERLRVQAAWIATGHHARDLAEDMLMRLIRGTGWPALGGMHAVDRHRHLLRPLLSVHPAALRELLAELHISHCEDPSNADTTFLRNRVRHTLLPLLEQENPRVIERLLALSHMAREDEAFFTQSIDDALAVTPWQLTGTAREAALTLPKALLVSLPRALRLRLYLRAIQTLAETGGGQARSEALTELDDAFEQGRGGKVFALSGGIAAKLAKGKITFFYPQRTSQSGLSRDSRHQEGEPDLKTISG